MPITFVYGGTSPKGSSWAAADLDSVEWGPPPTAHRHPTQRQVNVASAMMRAHDEQARAARAYEELPMHMDT